MSTDPGPGPDPRPAFLTVPEVATRLRVNPTTVRRWIQSGTLPGTRIGRDYRIDPDQLDQLVRSSSPLTMPKAPTA